MAFICLAPVVFLGLWGVGTFGGGTGLGTEERAACLVGVASLTIVLLLEYDNSSPWHQARGGLAIGRVLLENTTRLVVYCAINGVPPWKRVPAGVLLLAPLFYPPVVESLHRFQVGSGRKFSENEPGLVLGDSFNTLPTSEFENQCPPRLLPRPGGGEECSDPGTTRARSTAAAAV